jgi:hypothetical protein
MLVIGYGAIFIVGNSGLMFTSKLRSNTYQIKIRAAYDRSNGGQLRRKSAKSQNIRWSIKRSFENMSSMYHNRIWYGYYLDDAGKLAVDNAKADIIKRIFKKNNPADYVIMQNEF